MTDTNLAPETKSVAGLPDAFDELMASFESFKETNDRRLGEIERRMSADVITTEKVDRISRAMDEQKRAIDRLALKRARPAIDGQQPLVASEHKQAFDAYVRSGDERHLRALEQKDMSYGSSPDGGYLVPAEVETEIGRRLANISPIRSIASVRQVSSAVLKKPFAVTGPATGWVGETAARPKTNSPTLAELQFPTTELYAMPAATPTLLEDAAVDLDQWIAAEIEAAFAEQEGTAFVTGNGTNKPKGFLAYPTVADVSWSWGNIGVLNTGVAGAFPASSPSDVLVDLVYALKAGYGVRGATIGSQGDQPALFRAEMTAFFRRTLLS